MKFCWFLIVVCVARLCHAAVPWTPSMKTFGTAIKGGTLTANEEYTLFEHYPGNQGIITEQWFTGQGAMDENTIIRMYIDNETVASLEFNLFLAHGIGVGEATERNYLPWGTKRLSHVADGGISNTYRVPFTSSVRITALRPTTATFWYIVRGVENVPVILGDVILPSNARLFLYKQENVVLQPLEFITLANVSASSGAIFMATFWGNSTDENFLEACVRATIDGASSPMFLSSGTEDFFLSAYYFNTGLYHFENSGLTYKSGTGQIAAYKLFENDPVFFNDALFLQWRNMESSGGPQGCPSMWPPNISEEDKTLPLSDKEPYVAPVTVTTYVWVYQW